MNPDRLRLEWLSPSEGIRFAEVMNDFSGRLKELGLWARAKGSRRCTEGQARGRTRLVPYIKLVERERLRVPVKSQTAYEEFFASDEFHRLFDELIGEQLTLSQIVSLLGDSPLSTGELSERLGAKPSDVAKQINSASRQGLVRYDESRKRFALA